MSALTECIELLDEDTKKWISSMSANDLALVLRAIYKIPNIVQTLSDLKTGDDVTDDYNDDDDEEGPIINQSAAYIGQSGEFWFAQICRSLPSNYKLHDTTKQGKKGDFVLTYSNHGVEYSCLVEIKKYTTSVPKAQLDKFYTDLTFGNYDTGLIISMTSRVTGIADNIYLEDKRTATKTIPVMIIANITDETLIQACVQMLMLKIDAQPKYDLALHQLSNFITNINMSIGQSADTRRMLSELNMCVSKSIHGCMEKLISGEVQLKQTIKGMSQLITEVNPLPSDATPPLDAESFINLAGPLDQDIIKQILSLNWEATEFQTEGDIDLSITESTNIIVEIHLRNHKMDKLIIHQINPKFNFNKSLKFKKLFNTHGTDLSYRAYYTRGFTTPYGFEKLNSDIYNYIASTFK